MVQEIDCGNTELNLLTFRDLEVLEQCEIAVKVRRTAHVRPNQCALLTIRGRSDAGWVEVESGSVVPRIADQQRRQVIVSIRTQPARGVHPDRMQSVRK